MTFVRQEVVDLLEAHAPLTAIVGTRIYPLVIPQPAKGDETYGLPAITYKASLSDPEYTMTGRIDADVWSMDISAIALSYKVACQIADLVQAAIDTETASHIASIFLNDMSEDGYPLAEGSEKIIYNITLSFKIRQTTAS